MTLQELYETKYPKAGFISIYENGSAGSPDYADEYLETHGSYEVEDYEYYEKYDVLLVELKQ